MNSLKVKIAGLIALGIAFLAVAADIKTVDPGAWSTLRDAPRWLLDTNVPLIATICAACIAALASVILVRRASPKAAPGENSLSEAKPTASPQDFLSGLSDLEEEPNRSTSPKRQSIPQPHPKTQSLDPHPSPARLEKQDFDA